MNLSEQAMALGAEKAQLMFMLQKRTSEMEHIIADRDARIQQARDASQLGQRAIQEVRPGPCLSPADSYFRSP